MYNLLLFPRNTASSPSVPGIDVLFLQILKPQILRRKRMHRHIPPACQLRHARLLDAKIEIAVPGKHPLIPPPPQQTPMHNPRPHPRPLHSCHVRPQEQTHVEQAGFLGQHCIGKATIVVRMVYRFVEVLFGVPCVGGGEVAGI